ncbi:hypothetical protein SMICM304S_11715 [Streptomyces microflavus]
MFYALGLLARPNPIWIEAQRSDLVGEFLQTAVKANDLIDSALGGVLFVDEAYSLANSGYSKGDAYRDEALQVLLKWAEDNRDHLVVILAGYPEGHGPPPLHQPGLSSRFTSRVDFPSYRPLELTAIGSVGSTPKLDQPVGQRVQRDDDGPQQGGEAGLRSGDEAGDLERPGDRPVLGDEFADDHLDGGGEEHPDDDADAGDRARGQSGGGEGTGEQLGECRFGEHPDDQRGDGDAELGAGELEGEFAQGFDDGTGPPVALGGSAFGVGPVHGDEPEFGCHEESVGEDEEEGRREEQQGGWS